MTPIDPVTPVRENRRTMEPPYSDENPNLEATREGLGVAEDEARDAVEETYDTTDLRDEGTDFLDDEDELTGEEEPQAPELSAIHEGRVIADEDFEKESRLDEPDRQIEVAEAYREEES